MEPLEKKQIEKKKREKDSIIISPFMQNKVINLLKKKVKRNLDWLDIISFQNNKNIKGCITGKAIYEGKIDLKVAFSL